MTEWKPANPCTNCRYRVRDEQWPSCVRCLHLEYYQERVAAQKQLLQHLIKRTQIPQIHREEMKEMLTQLESVK